MTTYNPNRPNPPVWRVLTKPNYDYLKAQSLNWMIEERISWRGDTTPATKSGGHYITPRYTYHQLDGRTDPEYGPYETYAEAVAMVMLLERAEQEDGDGTS
jgi:hypothetical protein